MSQIVGVGPTIISIVIYNQLDQNLGLKETKYSLPHSFYGSEIQELAVDSGLGSLMKLQSSSWLE